MGEPDPETLERLRRVPDADWACILQRLTLYAQYKVRRLAWRPPSGTLPTGRQAQDLALDAIRSVWTGERAWNIRRYPELLDQLKAIVDSKCSHLVESYEHGQRVGSGDVEAGDEDRDPLQAVPDPRPSPEEERAAEQMLEAIARRLEGDTELELVFLGLREGGRPGEIAEDLGLTPSQVYNHIRTIKRRAIAARLL